MTSLDRAASAGNHIGLLDKERIIAPADYNRWLVPPAALAIHLCIGMAYGFSVFWLPLGRAVGVAQGLGKPIPCPGDATTFWGKVAITGHALFATDCDWTQFDLGWMSPCSSFCSAPLPPSGAAGSSGLGHAEPAWSPPCAGAVAF